MQILESSLIGLRSARLHLTSPNVPAEITLFPMVHIGEPAFYEAVQDDARNHDVVFLEGVSSVSSQRITRSYRWIGKSIPGLIIQPRFPKNDQPNPEIVYSDLSGEEFEAEWRKVPLHLRLMINVAAPLIGLRYRRLKSREALAKGHSLDDLTSRDDLLDWDPAVASIGKAILEARDRRLLDHIRKHLAAMEKQRLAVVYGAAHMRSVLRTLRGEFDYRVTEARWMTVFRL